MHWERPWAIWFTPVLAIAWWLLVVARKPRSMFTGAYSLWAGTEIALPSKRTRGAWPVRYWELAALACGLLALAGPVPQESSPDSSMLVIVDRSPSMYLPHGSTGGATRLRFGLERLKDWPHAGSLEFVDADSSSRDTIASWTGIWDAEPQIQRGELNWAE